MKVNLSDYMAYLEQKAAQKKDERREKVFEELDRENERRESERQALNDLFRKALKPQGK